MPYRLVAFYLVALHLVCLSKKVLRQKFEWKCHAAVAETTDRKNDIFDAQVGRKRFKIIVGSYIE